MKHGFFYRNSLTIIFLLLFIFSLVGQVFTGWKEHNETLKEHQQLTISINDYLGSGHFLQSTFENWESEFLQMALFVLLTIWLRQKGSSESKKCDGEEEVDREPSPDTPGAPWPVKKGGWILALYKHSLSIVLVLLFLLSFVVHWFGSNIDYNEEQVLKGAQKESMIGYLGNHRFWFESFQNWQSEFLSVFAIIWLSIYLRQKGSSQSKPVDAPNEETGE